MECGEDGEANEDARDALKNWLSKLEDFVELATSLSKGLRTQLGAEKVEKE